MQDSSPINWMNYFELLMQWVFLFALISLVVVPGYLFRYIARKYNKKRWVFLIYGLAVGVVSIVIFRLVAVVITQLYTFKNGSYTAVALLYLAAVIFIWGAYKITETYFARKKSKLDN